MDHGRSANADGRKVNLSHEFARQNVGVTQVGEHICLVTVVRYDWGYLDDETCRLEPIDNPLGPKVLTRGIGGVGTRNILVL